MNFGKLGLWLIFPPWSIRYMLIDASILQFWVLFSLLCIVFPCYTELANRTL